MRIRKSHLIGAVIAAAAFLAGAAGAQTQFDKTVADATSQDGPVQKGISGQKDFARQQVSNLRNDSHDPHRGPVGPGPRHTGHPENHNPHGDRPDWHGHAGGWGANIPGRHFGWKWDGNWPIWLGWALWAPRFGPCGAYYSGLLSTCLSDSGLEYDYCVGSGADGLACETTYQNSVASCNYQYNTVWSPFWRRCR
jgi:hypothetical protein